MSDKKEWLEFDGKLIRMSEIDYFEILESEIICNWHQNQKYIISSESYKEDKITGFGRWEMIKLILGIE
jgi:hypothetical protein